MTFNPRAAAIVLGAGGMIALGLTAPAQTPPASPPPLIAAPAQARPSSAPTATPRVTRTQRGIKPAPEHRPSQSVSLPGLLPER